MQQWIDDGGLPGNRAVSVDGILETHRRFCEQLPEDLLRRLKTETRKNECVSLQGNWRLARDVRVGQHVPVSPGALTRFLSWFEQVYGKLGKAEGLMAAAAHDRLLWMHPFVDGNGRVARLMSHAMLLSILDTGAVWSVARGLARNVEQYKSLLSNCDLARRNDLDGRERSARRLLRGCTHFFLTTCIDQVRFMEGLVQPDRLRVRVLLWANEEIALGTLPSQAVRILEEAVLHRGELPRGEVDAIAGTGDRQGRRILSELLARGVLTSAKRVNHPAFPAELAQRWMPGLFPELRS